MLVNQKRLLRVLIVVMISFGLLVVVRLTHIQGFQGDKFRQLAEQNRLYAELVPAERGIFLDRYDQPLVRNIRQYAVADDSAIFSAHRFISHSDALSIMATQSAIVRYQYARKYAFPSALAHVLGYTGAMSKEALLSDARKLLTDQTGVMGLEKTLDSSILGKPGKQFFEVDAFGMKRQRVSEQLAEAGALIPTTIDPYISQVLSIAMQGKRGAVVVLDVHTGHVLSLMSSPSFNSNDFQSLNLDKTVEQGRLQRIQDYFSNQQQVLFNRAISGMYPPGSVFKLITALSALENQAVKTDTEVDDQGILQVGEYEYANWYYTQYGRVEGKVNLEKAIARSNDIYFYKTAEWLGPNQLAETARLYGLGRKTGIELAAEAEGLVPDPAWKEKTLGEPWYLGNTFHFGIGQGDLLVTPLQIAQMVQAIANNQTLCAPTLLKDSVPQCHDLGVSTDATSAVLLGMISACSDGGTGYPFFPHNRMHFASGTAQEKLSAGMVACKTGTAEFGAADARGYRKTHAWFTAIVPTTQLLTKQRETDGTTSSSSVSAQRQTETFDLQQLHTTWLQSIQKHGFPQQLAIVVLVESSEAQPFAEGSRDAAPIAAFFVDWMQGNFPRQ